MGDSKGQKGFCEETSRLPQHAASVRNMCEQAVRHASISVRDVWTREQILKFEMEKDPTEVTEQDWINYFREEGEPENLSKIDKEMRKVRIDTTLMDAGSRISRLRNQIYRTLDQNGLQEYVEHADPNALSSGW